MRLDSRLRGNDERCHDVADILLDSTLVLDATSLCLCATLATENSPL